MDYKLLADTAVLAGEIMLTSGAETYRVEDTIRRILHTSGFEHCDVFAVTTGIMITLDDWRVDTVSITRRIGEKNTNLGNICKVNEISRQYCQGVLTLEEAFHSLKYLKDEYYPRWLVHTCVIAGTVGFTLLLGGGWLECIAAAMNGLFVLLGRLMNKRLKVNTFVSNMVIAFCIAFTSMTMKTFFFTQINLELLIAGSNMALLPGVAITNAIRDTLQGDYTSGGARGIEAFVTALSIGAGIGAGLAACGKLFGGVI